jgi:hypothetical protein
MIHEYMEMSQGNSCYSYIKQTKMPFFPKWNRLVGVAQVIKHLPSK